MCRKFSFLVSFVLVLGLVVIAQAASIDVTAPGDPLMGIPDDGDWPAGEAPPFVIDNNPYTKYLHFKGDDPGVSAGFRVTPQLNGMVVTGMTFTTGNDAPGRDPVAFELYGSDGALGDDGLYVLIASGDIVDFSQVDPWPRNTKNATPVTFANAVAYAHYKVLFTALRDPANGCCMQISEVELLSTVPDLPPNVASMDIGTTHQGDAWEEGGVYTIRGNGGDIWGGADAFRYVFRPLAKTGDPAGKVMKVNLASMDVTNPWAKCGLMIRESMDPGAKQVMMIVSGQNGVQIAARPTTGGGTIEVSRFTGDGQLPGVQPKEMWIQRNGDDVICSFWNWIIYMPPMSVGQWEHVTATVPMNEDVYVGMAVCSHDAGLLCRAVFEGPGILNTPLPPTPQPGSPVEWPSEPYNKAWLLRPEDGAERMPLTPTLSWIPGDNAMSSDVLMGTDPGALSPVANILASAEQSYTPDTPLEAGTVYYWQIVSQPGGEATAIMSFKTERVGTGMIDYCLWNDIGGTAVVDLTSNPRYPDDPSVCGQIDVLDSGEGLGDNYGGRAIGYLAPETSGDYTFWIAADDGCELWLSTTSRACDAVKICYWTGWTGYHAYDSYAEQKSAPIYLEGGETYPIWALWKEGGGGDHCSVAWEGPDSPSRTEIDGYFLMPGFVDYAASNTSPADGALLTVEEASTVSWTAGGTATSHNVYLGEDPAAMSLVATVAMPDTSVQLTTLEADKTYYYMVEADDGTNTYEGCVQSFSTATWVSMDIASWGGSATKDGDCWTIVANGGDIWGTGDQFHFVYQTPTFTREQGTVIAHNMSITNTNGWAKMGVMMRETTASGSKNTCMLTTPNSGENRASFQWRDVANSDSGSTHYNGVFNPEWVKLVRNGNVYSGYHSDDGVNWSHMGDHTVDLGSLVRVGICVTSHTADALTTAEICNYSFSTPDPRQSWNLMPRCGATGVSIHPVLNWNTGDGVASQRVYFSADEAAVLNRTATPAELPADATEYDPIGTIREALMLGYEYYWAVDSVMPDGTVILGELCSFTAEEYRLVDDFESYDADPEALPEQRLIPGDVLVEAVPPPDQAWVEEQFLDDGPTIVDDPDRGQVLSLDGDMDYVDCGNPDALNFGTGDWTICAWVKNTMTGTGDTNKGAIIANGGDGGGGKRYCLILSEQTEGLVTLVTDDDSKKRQAKAGTTLVNDDTWHHVLGIREGGQIRIYIDGVQEGSSSINEDLSGTAQRNFLIGAIHLQSDGSRYKDYAGLIDDARVYGAALSDDNILFLAEKGGTEPDAGGLVGHWKFDGDFTDSSGNGFDGTPMGAVIKPGYYGPTIVHWAMDEGSGNIATDDSGNDLHGAISGAIWDATTADGSASCLDFSGAGDYVVNEDAGTYLNGLGALTISLWIKSDVIDTDKGFIIGRDPEGNDQRGLRYDKAGAGCGGVNVIKYGVATNEGSEETESSENIQTTDWQHVMVTWQSGAGTTLYINGIYNQPNCPSTDIGGLTSGYTKLLVGKGGKDGAADASWDGKIDDVWILDRVATEGERRYFAGLGNLTLPDSFFPMIAEYLIETDASDTSGNNNHGIALWGDATIVADPERGAVASFDGDGDAVDVGNSELFNFMDDLTISVWVNLNSWGGSWGNVIVGKRGEGGVGWQLRRFGGDPRFSFTTRGTDNDDYPRSNLVPNFGQWYHLAAVRAGTEKRLYIDGVLDSTQGINANRINTCPHNVYVGGRANGDNTGPEAFFDGKVDELRIYNEALNIGQVRTLASYVPPSPIGDTWSGRAAASPKLDYMIAHGGNQSMRVEYTGDGAVSRLEPFRDGADPHVPSGDWTLGGAKALVIYFRGDPDNAPGQMFAQLTTTVPSKHTQRVVYNGDPEDLTSTEWIEWNLELHDLYTGKPFDPPLPDEGLPETKIKSVGVGIIGGGSGVLYFDDIRTYPTRCVPMYGPENDLNDDCRVDEGDLKILVGDWLLGDRTDSDLLLKLDFEGDLSDSSGNVADGTAYGAVGFETDAVRGEVLDLPGGDDQYVSIPPVGNSGNHPVSIACWAKADNTSIPDWTLVFGFTTTGGGSGSHFNIGSIGGPGGVGAHVWGWENTIFTDDEALEWRHYAMTYDGALCTYYGDGVIKGTQNFPSQNGWDLSPRADNVHVGSRITQASSFPGNVDDARIYNRELSTDEVNIVMSGGEVPIIYTPLVSVANLYDEEPVNSKKINFMDYAVLMQSWLEEKLWP